MNKTIGKILNCKDTVTKKLDWFPALLVRISVGVMFAETGWGKLHNLDKVTGFFRSLGIPAPGFHAHLVATTEFVGGSLLVLGLLTRLAAIPLSITMIVALITAKSDEITRIDDLFRLSEYLYLILLAYLIVSGPGRVSVDHMIEKKIK